MNDGLDLNFERHVGDWLQVQAPARAPASLLTAALDQVAVLPQERPIGQGLLGDRLGRSRALRYALVAVLLAAAVVAAFLIVGRKPEPQAVLGRLAYSLDGDIYLADWDGANAVRIADGSATAGYRFPRWSPDGRHLTYELWPEGGTGETLFVTDPTGAILTSFPGFWASWSPDSTKIATCCHEVHSIDGELRIRIAEPDGWVGNGDQFAGWTADGSAVLASMIMQNSADVAGAVWAFPVDGAPPYRFAEGWGGPNNRIASPDGARIAVYSEGSINIIDWSGTRIAAIGGFGGPGDFMAGIPWGGGDTWSPDGRRIAFGQYGRLNVFDVSSRTVTTLVTTDDSAVPLRWAPDGSALLYVRPNHESSPSEPSPASIWRVGADGSNPTLVVRGTSDGDWQWLHPDRSGG